MITRKNISNSYLSKKKRNRNRNKNDKVKQSGGASKTSSTVIVNLIAERLNFFKEFGKDASAADAAAAAVLEAENVKLISEHFKDKLISGTMSSEAIKTNINKNNTILTFVNLHGGLDGGYKIVPDNTIICFLNPINESLWLTYNDYSLDSFIQNLTNDQFDRLINNREYLNNDVESKLNYTGKHTFYNCFKNSTWYYPGNAFPNITLQVNKSDFTIAHNKKFPFSWEVVDIESNSDILTKTHNCSFFEETVGLTNKDYFDKTSVKSLTNTDIQPTINELVTDKYRIIIFASCRNLKDRTEKDFIEFNLQLEIYCQTINKQKVDTPQPTVTIIPQTEDTIIPQCGSSKNYYYLPEPETLTYKDLAYFDKFKQSYGGKVNSLMRLKKKFTDNSNKFKDIDYAYLCSFTLKQIIMFLSLPEISLDPEKYKQHWYELLTISKFRYPELINRINSMCDFFISNAGIANILYLYTGYQPIDDARTNLNSLIPILTEYKTRGDPELGLLEKVAIVQRFIPDNKKILQTNSNILVQSGSLVPKGNINLKELTINSSYDITNLRIIPFETLNIEKSRDSIIKFINLQQEYTYKVENINISTNQFIMDNSENVFIRFVNLKYINITLHNIDKSLYNLENCYIHNDSVEAICIEGVRPYNSLYINNFEFNTPNVQSIYFENINFKNKTHFDKLLSDLKTKTGNLTQLVFKCCGFVETSLELESSHFKEMGNITNLEFIECTFNVPEDADKRKDILETLLKDKNLDTIVVIQLEFDYSEGKKYLFDDKKYITEGSEDYQYIYNALKNNKIYEM